MTARRLKSVLIAVAVGAALAVPATVAAQSVPLGAEQISELYVHPSTCTSTSVSAIRLRT